MVRISTQLTPVNSCLQTENSIESLSDEDERFLSSLKEELNKNLKQPLPDTVAFIMNYSKQKRKV